MNTPIKVLYLDHTATLAGGEIDLAKLLESLDRQLVTPVVALAEDGPLVARLRSLGVETHVLPLAEGVRQVRKDGLRKSGIGAIGSAVTLLSYCRTIAKFARQNDIELIQTNSLKSDIYGAVAAKMVRLPVIWRMHDHLDPVYLPGKAVVLFRSLAKWMPINVFTNSASVRGCLFPSGAPAHVPVIYPGLTAKELSVANLSATRLAPGRIPRIGIVGRLMPWKGQHVFLEAASQVLKAGQAAEFVILGSPMFEQEAYEARLHQMVADLGIDRHVSFLGFRENVGAVLETLDVVVHASVLPEPFGQVIIESMAHGLPVIAANGGGVPEIISAGETGELTTPGDSSALAAALEGLLQDPARARRLGDNAYRHVRQRFTASLMARQTEAMYENVPRRCRKRPALSPAEATQATNLT